MTTSSNDPCGHIKSYAAKHFRKLKRPQVFIELHKVGVLRVYVKKANTTYLKIVGDVNKTSSLPIIIAAFMNPVDVLKATISIVNINFLSNEGPDKNLTISANRMISTLEEMALAGMPEEYFKRIAFHNSELDVSIRCDHLYRNLLKDVDVTLNKKAEGVNPLHEIKHFIQANNAKPSDPMGRYIINLCMVLANQYYHCDDSIHWLISIFGEDVAFGKHYKNEYTPIEKAVCTKLGLEKLSRAVYYPSQLLFDYDLTKATSVNLSAKLHVAGATILNEHAKMFLTFMFGKEAPYNDENMATFFSALDTAYSGKVTAFENIIYFHPEAMTYIIEQFIDTEEGQEAIKLDIIKRIRQKYAALHEEIKQAVPDQQLMIDLVHRCMPDIMNEDEYYSPIRMAVREGNDNPHMACRYLSRFSKAEIYSALLYKEDIDSALTLFKISPLEILPHIKRDKLIRYAKKKLIEYI